MPRTFTGHRSRGSEATQIRNLFTGCHNTTTWSEIEKEASATRRCLLGFYELLQSLFHSNSHGDGHTDHGVVTCVPETPGSPEGLPKVENFLRNNSFHKQSESLLCSPFCSMFNFLGTSHRQKLFVLIVFLLYQKQEILQAFPSRLRLHFAFSVMLILTQKNYAIVSYNKPHSITLRYQL